MAYQILLISGKKSIQKFIASKYHFASWSLSFTTVLEKYGYLSFEEAGPEILENVKNIKLYTLVIIGFIPVEFWSTLYIQTLRQYKGLIFLEGPAPREILEQFNIYQTNIIQTTSLSLSATLLNKDYHFTLNDQTLIDRPPICTADDIFCSESEILEKVARAFVKLIISLTQKYKREGCFYSNPTDEQIAKSILYEYYKWPEFKKLLTKGIDFYDIQPLADINPKKNSTSWLLFNSLCKNEEQIFEDIFLKAYNQESHFVHRVELHHGQYQVHPTVCNDVGLLYTLFLYIRKRRNKNGVISVEENTKIISEPLQKLWRAPPLLHAFYQIENFNTEIIARGEDNEPTLFRCKNFLISSFPILAYLVYAHTLPPKNQHFIDLSIKNSLRITHFFFKLLNYFCQLASSPLIKIMPWPKGFNSALTIRHDVDRPIENATFTQLLDFEAENQLGVSWYWIADRLNLEQAMRIKAVGHENGLHALSHQKENELSKIPFSEEIHGETWHGTGKEYWNSIISINCAHQLQFIYTEFVPAVWDFPCATYPYINEDGTVTRTDGNIIGITFNATVDGKGVTRKSECLREIPKMLQWLQHGWYLQILNHPDICFKELKSVIDSLPLATCWKASALEIAHWWKATHCRRYVDLQVSNSRKGEINISLRIDKQYEDKVVLKFAGNEQELDLYNNDLSVSF